MDQVQSVQSVFGAQSGGNYGPAGIGVNGVHISTLAQRLGPPMAPRRQSVWNCGVVAIFGVLAVIGLLSLGGYLLNTGPDRTVGLAAAVLCFGLIPVVFGVLLIQQSRIKRRYRENAAVWPVMMSVWRSAMVCLRCHGAFFPPDSIYAGGERSQLVPLEEFQGVVAALAARIAVADSSSSEPRSIPPTP